MGKASLLALFSFLLLLSHSNCCHFNSGDHVHHCHHHARRSLKSQTFNLTSVRRYLLRYGYLDPNSYGKLSEESVDENLRAGIKKYQTFFKLDPTGVLDDKTVHQMSLPRCGNADIVAKGSSAAGRLGNYGRMLYKIHGPAWQPIPRNLTFKIDPANQKFSSAELSNVFGSAFKAWEAFVPLRFAETSLGAFAGPSDIQIGFFLGDHGDRFPFDGPGQVLAHSSFPPTGILHLDAAETWEIDPEKLKATANSVDLQSVALHEVGHLLGLDHSEDPNAVMFPTLPPMTTKRILSHDDIVGIGQLYVPYSPPVAGSP